jgi:DNA-binding NtrC family response regulator
MAHGALFADADGRVARAALPARVRARAGQPAARPTDLAGELKGLERERIEQALAEAGGNRARAARRLGLTRQGLWRKLKRGAVDEPRDDTLGGDSAWRRRS